MAELHRSYQGLYADGAMIETGFDATSDDIVLVIARDHDTPDETYIMTAAQANELIHALSKALLDKWSFEHNAEPKGE